MNFTKNQVKLFFSIYEFFRNFDLKFFSKIFFQDQKNKKSKSFIQLNRRKLKGYREKKFEKIRSNSEKTEKRIKSAIYKKTVIMTQKKCENLLQTKRYEIKKLYKFMEKKKRIEFLLKSAFQGIWILIIRYILAFDRMKLEIKNVKIKNFEELKLKIKMSQLHNFLIKVSKKLKKDKLRDLKKTGICFKLAAGTFQKKAIIEAERRVTLLLSQLIIPMRLRSNFKKIHNICKKNFS